MSGELEQPGNTASCAPSVCESCGEPFGCGAQSSGCWCAQVKLTEEMRNQLRERFKNCLCRACLERFARGGEPVGPEKIFS
jgi:hypothetical protein